MGNKLLTQPISHYADPVAGQRYFVTDHEPENLFDFMAPFLAELGFPPAGLRIPYSLAYPLAWVSERVSPQSNFNRFAVIQTCIDHTYSHAKATKDFGYHPIVSKEEAFKRTLAWLKKEWGNGREVESSKLKVDS